MKKSTLGKMLTLIVSYSKPIGCRLHNVRVRRRQVHIPHTYGISCARRYIRWRWTPKRNLPVIHNVILLVRFKYDCVCVTRSACKHAGPVIVYFENRSRDLRRKQSNIHQYQTIIPCTRIPNNIVMKKCTRGSQVEAGVDNIGRVSDFRLSYTIYVGRGV